MVHSWVFIGSCDVIGMEFPKEEVGLLLYGPCDVFYSSDTHKCKNGVCVGYWGKKRKIVLDCGRRVPTSPRVAA